MPRAEVFVRLQDNTDNLVRDILHEAEKRLWHLNQQVWARQGAVTGCLDATLQELCTLLASHSAGAVDRILPGSPVRMETSEAQWKEVGLNGIDIAAILDVLRLRVLQFVTEADLNESFFHPVDGTRTQKVSGDDGHPLDHAALGLASESADREVSAAWLVQAALNSLKAEITGFYLQAQAEEMARQRDDSVAVQHLAGRFLANASHELRTPLTAVLGFSELLLEETYGDLNDGQRTAVNHIENSAQNLLEIINNLLDLMQFRAGKLQLQYRRVAARSLLRNIYEILLPLSKRRNVRFLEELPSDLGTVQADEGIVRHIVYYLLESAIRATPENGEVVLRAERAPNMLTIVTYDTALHFPPEAIENMNDAYPILENSPARGYEGWEIGLPLVRRYVDLHAGTLEIESSLESGTTIRVHLPAQRPTDAVLVRRTSRG